MGVPFVECGRTRFVVWKVGGDFTEEVGFGTGAETEDVHEC